MNEEKKSVKLGSTAVEFLTEILWLAAHIDAAARVEICDYMRDRNTIRADSQDNSIDQLFVALCQKLRARSRSLGDQARGFAFFRVLCELERVQKMFVDAQADEVRLQ